MKTTQQEHEVKPVGKEIGSPSQPDRSSQAEKLDASDYGIDGTTASLVSDTGSSLQSGTSALSDDSDVIAAMNDDVSAASGSAAAGGTGLDWKADDSKQLNNPQKD